MRNVLTAVANKAKTFNANKLNNFIDVLLPRVYTNISESDILALIPTAINFEISKSIGWPYETKGITKDRWYGVPITLESNVTELHQEIFKEAEYIPSETVKSISNNIIKNTGYSK